MSSEDFGILLNLAYGVFKDDLHAALAKAGYDDLGPSFGYVFRLLADQPRSLAEVAAQLGITPQGALKIVDEMVARRYVERSAHPQDGRIKLLSLTARGRQALAAAHAFHLRFERELAASIGAGNAQAARAALEHIAARAREGALPRPA
ncbi:MAG TPA: MarR family transcriptional regulator [Telluria sp.]|nr:MarR family transcriptional regulator [Telluria sp.]